MRRIAIITAFITVLVFPLVARSQQDPSEAMEIVKSHVNSVLKVLRNPALKGEKGEKQKRAEIKEEANKLFDFVELSKRTLGLGWNRFSQEQRKEFVRLYKELLEETYIDRITAYTNEKVEFTEAVPLGGNTVEVRSVVTAKTGQVPINYRVMNEGGGWKVYDVVIEGVSLIANYRTQFREILANQQPEALIDTLKKRVGETP
ncbi:MAG: putative phospholipid-binding protein MlaC precursor [Syntrophorhabdaceae bacterium PtaU1.Bin034]|jgi:phospholipid transport system substrate-binding protein|nr:MAG: putative phospholipid-binding protein MlaC precursor [Syntrophorhabdaceae bacterium PtaU1.Bin034]